jgi:hypothetical protein
MGSKPLSRLSGGLACALCLILEAGTARPAYAQVEQPPSEGETRKVKPEKQNALGWAGQLVGQRYYLTHPEFPLLINDPIEVVRCKIRYVKETSLETGAERTYYTAGLSLQSVSPAPQARRRLTVPEFQTLDELEAYMSRTFSNTPLEDGFDWPPEIKRAVRARYIALGMDKEMVELALGGMGYQVDLERLDDGRVRETWKLQVKGDTRTAFTSRQSTKVVRSDTSSEASVSATTSTQYFGGGRATSQTQANATGSSQTIATQTFTETGFYVFGGLPPQFMHVIFTDGKVTARKTEFVK